MLMLYPLYFSISDATIPKMPMLQHLSLPYWRRSEISPPRKQTHYKSFLVPPLSHRRRDLYTLALELALEIEAISSTYIPNNFLPSHFAFPVAAWHSGPSWLFLWQRQNSFCDLHQKFSLIRKKHHLWWKQLSPYPEQFCFASICINNELPESELTDQKICYSVPSFNNCMTVPELLLHSSSHNLLFQHNHHLWGEQLLPFPEQFRFASICFNYEFPGTELTNWQICHFGSFRIFLFLFLRKILHIFHFAPSWGFGKIWVSYTHTFRSSTDHSDASCHHCSRDKTTPIYSAQEQ